jgi:hypothetical protein
MNRRLSVLAFILFATHAYAQDVDFGAFGDAGSLLSNAPARAGTAAPARAAGPAVPPPDRLVRLRDALLKAEVPMTKEQEVALNKLLDTEIPAMRKTLQTHGQQMLAARAPRPNATPGPAAGAAPGAATPTPTPGPAPAAPAQAAAAPTPTPAQLQAAAAARGATAPPAAAGAPGAAGAPNPALLAAALAARGAPPSSRVPAEVLDALEVEMRQMNDALFTKIASAPALDEKQQAVLTKMSRNQIKARGGFDALRVSMEDAGVPFTEQQLPQVQALFEEQKKSREALAKETQGTPDPAKLKQLETVTLTKVVGLLVPAQRTALLALLRAPQ